MPKTRRPSRFRLDPAVRPTDYELLLEPDLRAGTFRGEVRIDVEIARPRPAITLHAADLTVESATIESKGSVHPVRLKPRRADEAVTLVPARRVAGSATLVLSFSGQLGTHLRGLYAAASDGRRYAFTQCEAADARRDPPLLRRAGFKARFGSRSPRAERRGGLEQPDRARGAAPRRPPSRALRGDAAALDVSACARRRAARGVGGAHGRRDADPRLARAGQGAPHRLRPRGRRRSRCARLEDVLRHPVSLRQARPRGRARLRGRRDGERRRRLLPRDAPAPRSGHRVARRAQARRRGHRPRARAHVVRRPRHHGVVGRPLAERGVRHLDGLPGRRRLAARVAHVAGLRARPRGRAGARRARQHAPDLRARSGASPRRPRTSTSSPTRRARRWCA